MRIIEILGEKINPNVTFQRIEAAEGNKNRGWQVDQINAYLGDELVGYLKISYIPSRLFADYYPGILNYLAQIEGKGILPYTDEATDWRQIPIERLKPTISRVADLAGYHQSELDDQVKNMDDTKFIKLYANLVSRIEREHGWKLKRFKTYYVDKPVVDYIRVMDEYKRQGIGTALYQEGSKWMREKGLKLYASGTQSSDAKAAWKSLEKTFDVKRARDVNPFIRNKRLTRRYIE